MAASDDDDDDYEEVPGAAESPPRAPAEQPPPVKVRKKREVVFPNGAPPWADSTGKTVFHGTDEKEGGMWELAQAEFQGAPSNKVFWVSQNVTHRKKENSNVQVHRCAFHYQCGCPYQIRTITDIRTDNTSIYKGIVPHSDHSINNYKSQPPKQVVTSVVQSPSHILNSGPTVLMRKAAMRGLNLPEEMQTKTVRKLERLKRQVRNQHLDKDSDGRAWGDLITTIDSFKCSSLVEKNEWSPYAVYLLGDAYESNSDTRRFIAAVASEEQLLNAYRQMCTGQDLTFAIDTSYRYTKEKSGLMPIKAISFNQTGHIIAYGIVSNEDDSAHAFILGQVKKEVERVVAERVRTQTPI